MRTWWLVAMVASGAIGLAVAHGCSAGGGGTDEPGLSNGGGNPGAGTSVGGDGGAGLGDLDGGVTDAPEDSAPCTAVGEEAAPKLQPADIVFVVDTSGSMGEESYYVRTSLNSFSQQIVASGIDVRVIMIAEAPPPFFPCNGPLFCPPGICVDPPLGSGLCPEDSSPPAYHHIKISDAADENWGDVGAYWDVYSTDGLHILYHSFNDWQPLLRQEASKSFVIITDDDATFDDPDTGLLFGTDPDSFLTAFPALDPQLLAEWKMSGIYCFTDCEPAASPGVTWQYIVDQTGGVHGDLCQQDFQPIFDDLATAIVIGAAQLSCEWDIPEPPPGETLDPAKVNVLYTDGDGVETTIYHVDGPVQCDPTLGGWYYDNNVNPTTIILCEVSCDFVSQDPDGKIDILFGCATEPLPPPE